MNNIQSFTTLATKMGQKPSAGGEAVTPREQQTLSRLLGEMSAGAALAESVCRVDRGDDIRQRWNQFAAIGGVA